MSTDHDNDAFPMRLNKYLAHEGVATRRDADELIKRGIVHINGKRAVLGDKVNEGDVVELSRGKRAKKALRYAAYHKPRGVITHSPDADEEDIREVVKKYSELHGLFPVGRLDKDSHGLIILTDDGRITDRLLNPDRVHEKEYVVKVREPLRESFKLHMEAPINLGDFVTKPCRVQVTGEREFRITLTEGKKHQVRRMAEAMHLTVTDLKRVRIMNVRLAGIPEGGFRMLTGDELSEFLAALELPPA